MANTKFKWDFNTIILAVALVVAAYFLMTGLTQGQGFSFVLPGTGDILPEGIIPSADETPADPTDPDDPTDPLAPPPEPPPSGGGETPLESVGWPACDVFRVAEGKPYYTLISPIPATELALVDACGDHAWNHCDLIGKSLATFDVKPSDCCAWLCTL